MLSRFASWLPVVVVLVTTLIYVWLLTGAPGKRLIAGVPTDLPSRERAYPGRDRLGAIDPMGVKPWLIEPPGGSEAEAGLPPDDGGRR